MGLPLHNFHLGQLVTEGVKFAIRIEPPPTSCAVPVKAIIALATGPIHVKNVDQL